MTPKWTQQQTLSSLDISPTSASKQPRRQLHDERVEKFSNRYAKTIMNKNGVQLRSMVTSLASASNRKMLH